MRFLDLCELHLQDLGFFTRMTNYGPINRSIIRRPFDNILPALAVNNFKFNDEILVNNYPRIVLRGSDVYWYPYGFISFEIIDLADPLSRVEDPDCLDKIVRVIREYYDSK